MLPGLLQSLTDLPLFGYISFRMVMAGLTAFAIAMLAGGPAISWLRSHKVGENATKTDLAELAKHAEATGKHGTPTMGGSFLVGALLISVLLWCRLDNIQVVLAAVLVAGLAAVGFVDDYLKLTVKGSSGLTPKAKLIGQFAAALFVIGALVWYARASGSYSLLAIYPPLAKNVTIPLGESWYGVIIFVALAALFIVGTSNAANITDGLDGLAAGLMLISGGALSAFCYVTGRYDWTQYLNLPFVPAAAEMAVVGAALCGACMGFLWFNAFPARVFMGDSGSLPIGGLLAWMALVAKQELVLPLLGFGFYAELGSSFLQTFWYKRSGGKRIFTVAPIHHGLQLKGGIFKPGAAPMHEVTVTVRAWIIASVCALASLALLKVR
ncbi:MAG: phospho-N-acetylmuramoyl-pentapeptide-transferase [Planctomycetota bacterium]|jgi:phospho-N-acetylmuramoyl-pentapeptide-transferase